MKKNIFFILLLIMIILATGCGANNNNNNTEVNSSKEYNMNGVSFQLDRNDSISKMNYITSSSFDRRVKSSTTTYCLYYDESKDKYDISNIAFSFSVTADIMQTESKIEYDINKLNNNSSLKNISREQKKIKDITWEYISLDNYYETGTNEHFKNHSYYYETYDGKYYTTYMVSFNKAEDIEDLENDILNSIVFES